MIRGGYLYLRAGHGVHSLPGIRTSLELLILQLVFNQDTQFLSICVCNNPSAASSRSIHLRKYHSHESSPEDDSNIETSIFR